MGSGSLLSSFTIDADRKPKSIGAGLADFEVVYQTLRRSPNSWLSTAELVVLYAAEKDAATGGLHNRVILRQLWIRFVTMGSIFAPSSYRFTHS